VSFSLLIKNVIFLCLIGAVAGLIFALIPAKYFDLNRYKRFFKFEHQGKFYEKYLRISLWKDKLPQFSKIFHIGYNKEKMPVKNIEMYKRFIIETIRAEATHWFLIIVSPVYYIADVLTPWFLILASVIANLPFIAIQRYNRIRITKIVCRLENKFLNFK
jgi:glycosyl-4,4'-diaponeurosporenoate acyltransferase